MTDMHDAQIIERHDSAVLGALALQPPDPLLALIKAFRSDPRADKIDVGVGVYRDDHGRTPVFRAVKEAERCLVAGQETKAYVGAEGDIGFFEALKPIIFGLASYDERLSGLQTVGGTGALRVAAELTARARLGARVWVGNPTWPNHPPILKAAGLTIMGYEHVDLATQRLSIDRLFEALERAAPGDVALLHGCCHNPTGADFDIAEWAQIAELLRD